MRLAKVLTGTTAVLFSAVCLIVFQLGAGICIFATGGACALAVPIFGGAALTFIASGATDSVDVFNSIVEKAEKMDEIDDLQGELVHSLTRPEPPLPDS